MKALMEQLHKDKDVELKQKDDKFNDLLMEDSKYTPAEYFRRKRLRTISNKLDTMKKNPKKMLFYFLGQTSFTKGGKITAAFKRVALTISSLSHINTLGTEQINFIRKEIENALKDKFSPKDGDTIMVQGLREKITNQVKTCFNELIKAPESAPLPL